MVRAACYVLALLAVVSIALGDVVYLKDGGRKEGKVIGKDNGVVVLQVQIGKLTANVRYPEEDVARIEEKLPPAEEFDARMAKIQPDDADAFYKLGLWAEDSNLADRAKTAYEKALRAGKGNAGAAAKLGCVRMDGNWVKDTEAVKQLEAAYEKGDFESVYNRLSVLKDIPNEALISKAPRLRGDAFMLYAKSCERLGKWSEAIEAWRRFMLVDRSDTNTAIARAHIGIIEDHPDGRFSCDRKDLPPLLLELDPSVLPIVNEGGTKSLTDRAVMSLALRAEAAALFDEARKFADKVVDRSESSYKAWQTAASRARAAQALLARSQSAKGLRLTIIKKVVAFADQTLQQCADGLEAKVKAYSAEAFTGKPDEANDCLQAARDVLDRYTAMAGALEDLQNDLPDEYAKAKEGVARETKRVKWLEDQVQVIEIRKRTEGLDAKAVAAMNKAKAADPRGQQYLTSSDTGEFQDGGKSWRQRTDASIRFSRQAYASLTDMLQEYCKRSEVFGTEIERTKSRMAECDALEKAVIANRNRQGVPASPW